MKNLMKVTLSALLLAGLASCSQEEPTNNYVPSGKMQVSIQTNMLTSRTAFDEKQDDLYPGLWTNGESAKVYLAYTSGNLTVDGTVETADQKYATINAEMDIVEGSDFTYMASVPADNWVSYDATTGVRFTVPESQTPPTNSFDPAASTLIGKSETYETQQGEAAESSTSAKIDMDFAYAVAYGKMAIENLATAADETIISVALVSTAAPLAGSADFLDGNVSAVEGTSTISINTSLLTDIWFASLPATLADGEWKVVVTTSAGTYERTIDGTGKALTLALGVVAEFTIDMTNATFSGGEAISYTRTINATDEECTYGGDSGIKLENGYIKGINFWRKDGHATATFDDVPQAGVYRLKLGTAIWTYADAPEHVFNFHITINGGTAVNHTIAQPTETTTHLFYEYVCEITLVEGTNTITINGGDRGFIDGYAPHIKYFTVTNEADPVTPEEPEANFPNGGATVSAQGTF